jgi:hypothetical protein
MAHHEAARPFKFSTAFGGRDMCYFQLEVFLTRDVAWDQRGFRLIIHVKQDHGVFPLLYLLMTNEIMLIW